jgi:hypothetical protein
MLTGSCFGFHSHVIPFFSCLACFDAIIRSCSISGASKPCSIGTILYLHLLGPRLKLWLCLIVGFTAHILSTSQPRRALVEVRCTSPERPAGGHQFLRHQAKTVRRTHQRKASSTMLTSISIVVPRWLVMVVSLGILWII